MIRRHHQKGITFIVAMAILLAAAGVLALTQSQPAPAQDLKAIKADYRRPAALPVENKALANLGRDLFFDTRISASGRTSCASCHLPELGYVVTEAHPINDFRQTDLAQVTAADRARPRRQGADRLGRAQRDT